MPDSHVVCPVCHGDGFIVKEYRRRQLGLSFSGLG
jgi:hypothetical protein